ncbi:MAG: efflux RND transporter permease subunit [Deltaproteobacteria bacterium]|nr:efflux RND transporter permease subunit [Deltaproteobacteria bacterium]
MTLSSLAVRRGVTFGMVYLIVVGFGLFSLSRLQLDLYPDISFPTVIVITSYIGANPDDIETLVTRPLEGAVASVKGVKELNSDSKQGVSLINIEFEWGQDMEQAETDVRRAIDMVKGLLPDDTDAPIVFAFDPSMQPVVMMMISGSGTLDELRSVADDEIAPRLERLDGIASAEAAGGLEREIHVTLDPTKIEAFGLDVNQVVAAIYQENRQEPGGYVEQGSLEFDIHTLGKYQSVDEIGEIAIGARKTDSGPVPLRLKEVAAIEDTFFESRRILEVDGEPAVWMIVRKQSGANTVRASERVINALPGIAKASGQDVRFRIIFNQADYISSSLGNLSTTAIYGILISFLVLLFFLRNIRSSLIVSTAIPLSVVATFAAMDQAGMTLNVLSLAGLALSVGMLVDNGIVVLENIFRLREEGRDAWDASINGAADVGTAVTASTLTTVSVFVPVLFVPGIAGVMFKDMAVTICIALMVSLIVALTFIPLASSRLLGTARADGLLKRAKERARFERIRDYYGKKLDWTLAHRWVVLVVLAGVLALTGAMVVILPTDFMAQDDNSFLFVQAEAPVGTSLDESYKRINEVAERVKKVVHPNERRMVATDIGVGKGFVAIFSKGVHAGILRVPLVKPDKRKRSKKELEDALREDLSHLPGVETTVKAPFSITGGEGDIEVRIRGHDLETSRDIGLELKKEFEAMPDIGDVTFSMESQKPRILVRFNRRKMAELGLSTAKVGQAVTTAFMGRVAARYAEGGDEYDIRVRYGRKHRLDIDEIRRMPVATQGGVVVPLQNIAEVKVGLGPVNITRLDQERVTRLNLYLEDQYEDADGDSMRKDLGASISRVSDILDDYAWPEDFTWTIGGSAEDFMTSFKYMGIALTVSVLLVYMVMAGLFESLLLPFIILLSVPLAGIGVALMFSITRSTLDISALIGVIMLVGIVVNNAIVMVDAANQLRLKGKGRTEAIAGAARIRLRPILLTSLTTIMAMVPMAMGIGEGAENWSGMAKSVIGGLLSASFLTLFVIPTMYTVFARKRIKSRDKLVTGRGA